MGKVSLSSAVRSSLRPNVFRRRRAVLSVVAVLAAFALPMAVSLAADTYVEPQVELRVEQNTNFDLVPGGSAGSNVYGYIVDAQALIGFATPRSDTSLRPRLRLQEFPDREDLQRVEAFFDLRSRYDWQRSNFLLIGRYSRQDVYNADTPSGVFDPLDPDYTGNPDSAQIVIGETRTTVELRPTFEHKVTERATVGVAAGYEIARYDADSIQTKTDYDYGGLNGFVNWALSPISDFTVGAYASRFETRDDSVETDAVGGELGFRHRWSESNGIEATAFYEKNDTTVFIPVRLEESTTDWGGSLTAVRDNEISTWRLTLGRMFTPTGDSGKSQSDQVRLQYDRALSQRLSLRGVGRYESRSALGATGGGEDRDYARMDVSLKWFASPKWYLGGGYSYIWEDRAQTTNHASNSKLFINFGYQGLSRQGRSQGDRDR
jgi:hypothetical protein